MPELREVFEMTTKHIEPAVDPWRGQLERQRKASRKERITAIAVVVAIGLAIVAAWALWTDGDPGSRTPAAPAPRAHPHRALPTGSDRVGLVGLAPEGWTPSQPTKGQLVLGLTFGHTSGDPGRVMVSVYADGRLIWQRLGDTIKGTYSTGLLQQRLTPAGVDLLVAEARSTGLFDDDRNWTDGQGLHYGQVRVLVGDRFVRLRWGGSDTFPDITIKPAVRVSPTCEEASALRELDEALENPASWLPASAWLDPMISAYVPSEYSVCYHARKELAHSQVLGSLPPAAADLLRAKDWTQGQASTFVYWCSHVTTEEARALARNLNQAGFEGAESEFGLTYGPTGVTQVSLEFVPLLPHET